MKVAENEPVKLVSTTNNHYRAAIFGLIMDYTPLNIHFFLESLACTGYNDTFIVLYSKISNETEKYIISFSNFFEIIMIPVSYPLNYMNNINLFSESVGTVYKSGKIQNKIQSKSFQKVDMLNLNFECGDFRFEIAYYLYRNHFFDDYDLLLLTDIGDVILQSDIRFYNYTEGVYVAEEAGISIKDSHYWLEMYISSYSSFEEKCELCVGTLILVGQKGFSFLNDLHNQIKDHLDIVFQRPNFQGTLNFLVYNNTYNYSKDYIKFMTTKYGIVNSIAKLNGHMINFNKTSWFRKVRNLYDIYYHDQNYILYNHYMQKLAVIHHTKYLPITQDFTFSGIMNVCKHLYPQNHKEIMKIRDTFEDCL